VEPSADAPFEIRRFVQAKVLLMLIRKYITIIKIDAFIITKFEIFKISKLRNLVKTTIKNQNFDGKEVILIFLHINLI
jgi:hypothetical protein